MCALGCLASISSPPSARLRAVKLCLWILMPTANWVAGRSWVPAQDSHAAGAVSDDALLLLLLVVQCHARVLLRVLVAASASLWDSITAGSQLHGPEVRIGLQGADEGQVIGQWEARQMATST